MVQKKKPQLFSYVVRYDSGFAPNPFYGYCTLATCKPGIREFAQVGDWVVGTGSADKSIRRGGHLVYAMRVTEVLSTQQYWLDPRFESKRPNLNRTWMTAAGDNIYDLSDPNDPRQLKSYHSSRDGTPNEAHCKKDTEIPRILVSDTFVYYGGEGPQLPSIFRNKGKLDMVNIGAGYKRISHTETIRQFEKWLEGLGEKGICGKPLDWVIRSK